MELKDIKIDYDITKYEQQVTKEVRILKEIKLNHWVTLKVGDIIYFKQSFAGMKYPTSPASYEMYINGRSGGGGTQNCLLNLLDEHYPFESMYGFSAVQFLGFLFIQIEGEIV